MRMNSKKFLALMVGATIVPMLFFSRARGSDHADTPAIAAAPGTDLSDVYIFPSPADPNNVVLIMNCRPLIPQGQASNFSFDSNVLYQFKIDNNGDAVEDLVIQARFNGTGPTQTVSIAGPIQPSQTGTASKAMTPFATTGTINQSFSPTTGMQAFAGAREDSFFFDLERFFQILPDRGTTIPSLGIQPPADPNQPQATSWRPVGQAVDFLSNGGFNVLSIVVELPKSRLIGSGNGQIGLWCTTSM